MHQVYSLNMNHVTKIKQVNKSEGLVDLALILLARTGLRKEKIGLGTKQFLLLKLGKRGKREKASSKGGQNIPGGSGNHLPRR